MVTDKQPSSRTPTQEIVIASEASGAVTPDAAETVVDYPVTDEPSPKPSVSVVTIHAWPYGERLWIEIAFKGDNVATLQTIYGGQRVWDSIAAAAMSLGADLHVWDVRVVFLTVCVVEHPDPKRAPKLGTLAETGGELDEEGVEIEFGGACPVQGQGMIDGHPCYYRARGSGWSLDVFESGARLEDESPWPKPLFEIEEDPYAWPDGGWLHHEESEANIRRGVAAFRDRDLPVKTPRHAACPTALEHVARAPKWRCCKCPHCAWECACP